MGNYPFTLGKGYFTLVFRVIKNVITNLALDCKSLTIKALLLAALLVLPNLSFGEFYNFEYNWWTNRLQIGSASDTFKMQWSIQVWWAIVKTLQYIHCILERGSFGSGSHLMLGHSHINFREERSKLDFFIWMEIW